MLQADPALDPKKSHEILKEACKDALVQQIGVHVGNFGGMNYTIMFHEILYLDFILPTI